MGYFSFNINSICKIAALAKECSFSSSNIISWMKKAIHFIEVTSHRCNFLWVRAKWTNKNKEWNSKTSNYSLSNRPHLFFDAIDRCIILFEWRKKLRNWLDTHLFKFFVDHLNSWMKSIFKLVKATFFASWNFIKNG